MSEQHDDKDPARGWLFVERLIAEGQPEPEHVPTLAELVGPLPNPKAPGDPAQGWMFVEGLMADGTVRTQPAAPSVLPPPAVSAKGPGHWVWVAAAAAILGAAGWFVWMKAAPEGGHDLAAGSPEPGSPEAVRQAGVLRQIALPDCDKALWASCLEKLDEAKRLDPPGDAEPRITAARKRAAEARPREPQPK